MSKPVTREVRAWAVVTAKGSIVGLYEKRSEAERGLAWWVRTNDGAVVLLRGEVAGRKGGKRG
jgi:hypothetical protein